MIFDLIPLFLILYDSTFFFCITGCRHFYYGMYIGIMVQTFIFQQGCLFYDAPLCDWEGRSNSSVSLVLYFVFLWDNELDGLLSLKLASSCMCKILWGSSFTDEDPSGLLYHNPPWSCMYKLPCSSGVMFSKFKFGVNTVSKKGAHGADWHIMLKFMVKNC